MSRSIARLVIVPLGVALLAACQSVVIAPEPVIPTPLVVKMPVRIGVVMDGEQKTLKHAETRGGTDWAVSLGEGNQVVAKQVFDALFQGYVLLDSLDAARGQPGIAAIFEPKMEQYSFATARETGGDYYAVTLRYRINVYDPELKLVDSYTLTGYGNSRDEVLSSSGPLEGASRAAMRDAAAKILVQFPEQTLGKQLAKGESLKAPDGPVVASTAVGAQPDVIDTVPVLVPKSTPAPPDAPKLL